MFENKLSIIKYIFLLNSKMSTGCSKRKLENVFDQLNNSGDKEAANDDLRENRRENSTFGKFQLHLTIRLISAKLKYSK